MRRNLVLTAALTSSLFLMPLAIAPASAGPGSSNLKSDFPTPGSAVELVRNGGEGGGNGGGGGGPTGHSSGGPAMAADHANGPAMGHGRTGSTTGKMNGGPKYAGKSGLGGVYDSGGSRQSANRRGGQYASHDDHGRDRHDGNHRGHGHFVGGVWVYDAGSYASTDCFWMRQRAIATGSPYLVE